MKKLVTLSLCFFISFTALLSQNINELIGDNTDKRHKNIYVEGLGGSFLVGFGFDIRLKPNTMDGLGVKIGIGGVDSYRVDTWFRSYFIERNGFNKPPFNP